MAADASAVERAHGEIKALILAGKLPLRTRIDVETLARTLGLSTMPVRQALSALAWERLVKARANAGYEVALFSVKELISLYAWRASLMDMVLPTTASGMELKRLSRTAPYPHALFNVMRLLDANANPELQRAALNADERLSTARLAEAEVLGDVEAELEHLAAAIGERSKRMRTLVRAFHRRRIARASAVRERVIIRALANNGAK